MILIQAAFAGAAEYSFTPTADAHVRNGNYADSKNGTSEVIEVENASSGGYGRIGYFNFDIGSFPGKEINAATLRLCVKYKGSGNTINVLYGIESDAIDENTITWNYGSPDHNPGLDTYEITDKDSRVFLLDMAVISDSDRYYEFDVTDFVNTQLINNNKSVLFMISAKEPDGIRTIYHSKESPDHHPILTLTPPPGLPKLSKISETTLSEKGMVYDKSYYGLYVNQQSYVDDGLISFRGYQYSAYYNSDRRLCVARRKLPNVLWETAIFTDYSFDSKNCHNVVSMGISARDGTIHLAFDSHCTPLHYRISQKGVATNPESNLWSPSLFSPVTSELINGQPIKSVTYPRFTSSDDGILILRFRAGGSGNGEGYIYKYEGNNKGYVYKHEGNNEGWDKVGRHDSKQGRYAGAFSGDSNSRCSYYDGFMYDRAGRLHGTFMWRENSAAAANHDIHYVYSDDDGKTWYDTKGVKAGVSDSPDVISIADSGTRVWKVDEKRGLVNQQDMYVDKQRRVHIVTQHIPDENPDVVSWNDMVSCQRYYHYWRDTNGQWERNMIPRTGARAKILVDDNGDVYLIYAGGGYGFPARLSIMKGTYSSGYSDWDCVYSIEAPSQDVVVDKTRFKDEKIISVRLQASAEPGEGSRIYVIDLAESSLLR